MKPKSAVVPSTLKLYLPIAVLFAVAPNQVASLSLAQVDYLSAQVTRQRLPIQLEKFKRFPQRSPL